MENERQQELDAELRYSAARGRLPRVQELLELGSSAKASGSDGATALMMALSVCSGQAKAIVELLMPISDLNAVDVNGWSAISWAAHWNDESSMTTIKSMLEMGARPRADKNGVTDLMRASVQPRPDLARALLPFSNAKDKDGNGRTARDHAKMACRAEAEEALAQAEQAIDASEERRALERAVGVAPKSARGLRM